MFSAMVFAAQPSTLPGVLSVIDRMLAAAAWDGALLGGPRTPPAEDGEPPARCLPFPRMTVFFAGGKRHVQSRRGERVPVDARPGQVLHWTTEGWDLDLWDPRQPCHFGGLVFRREYLRVLEVDFPGGPPPPLIARNAHHTRLPLGGAAQQILDALEALAVIGPSPDRQAAVGCLTRALVVLARAHVAEDLAGVPVSRSVRTWQEVLEFVEERLAEPLSRKATARAMGLHANYISALCTRHGGASFQRTVERLRLERAKALLAREADLTVAATAARCGYPDAGYFIRVFRSRFGTTPRQFARGGGCHRPG